ncbi:hypothetical protein GWI33_007207, partial [Rhynchophorus ferrugineus]
MPGPPPELHKKRLGPSPRPRRMATPSTFAGSWPRGPLHQ